MTFRSVVKVHATTQKPDYDAPWMGTSPSSSSGSGVVIGPGQVLTGAHVVANATFVQIQKLNDPTKVVAHIVAISHDLDLALLEVRALGDNRGDANYLDAVPVAELGELPRIQDRVSVVGYPVGGEEVSITEGVVSRIEVQEYAHSQRNALAVTVDAAINDGNSGGPVIDSNRVVGIAFQTREGAEAIGEIVPVPLIRHFLSAVRNRCSTRLPGLGIRTMKMENPALRRRYGLGRSEGGVLVTGIAYGSSAFGYIQEGDVLLHLDGYAVAENATVLYQGHIRTAFDVVLGDHHIGDTVQARIQRDGEAHELQLLLKEDARLVGCSRYEQNPIYIICGGIVLQPLSRDFLEAWSKWWHQAPKELLHIYYEGLPTKECQGIVVVSQVLADEVNVGYQQFTETTVLSINGKQPVDIQDMARILAQTSCSEDLEIRTSYGGKILMNMGQAQQANQRILERYRIPNACSEDLEEILRGVLIPC
ncbi:MAG: trypsin-like peptidase domain-containing protein [Myxococcales bacterium]|nr:trypsin-like peptidase domain-containing protein [Myxococcales bacterium]